jgi:hypothetical protein
MEEKYYPQEAFRFLYETRLRKMGFNADHIAEDLREKLAQGEASFNLIPVKKEYPDKSVLTLTITNIDRDKNEGIRDRYYLNGPIEVSYRTEDGILTNALIPLDNQQGPHIDAIKNIMDGNTPYLTINSKDRARDKMYILSGEMDERGNNIVKVYGANIDNLEAQFKKLPLVNMTQRQKEFLFDSIKNGNVHKVTYRNNDGNREECYVQASRSNDMLTKNKEGNTVTLVKTGLERVVEEKQEKAVINNVTKALANKQNEKNDQVVQEKKKTTTKSTR